MQLKRLLSILWIIILFNSCKSNHALESKENPKADTKIYLSTDDRITKLINGKKYDRVFFTLMDSITTYKCDCEDEIGSSEYKLVENLYIYFSLNSIQANGQSIYKFNYGSDVKRLLTPPYLIIIMGDTLKYQLINDSTNIAKGSEVRDTRSFLILNGDTTKPWQSEGPMGLGGDLLKITKIYKQTSDFNSYKVIEYGAILMDAPYIEEMYVSRDYGIVFIKFNDGAYDYNCWMN